ncbi:MULTISPECIES: lanthionine synthetase C family protein [unclassified Streptomyces]|uniref:lanthionine synthetase C family protein n=1 Tax=unclassified Streptomyces TaxID=2593676 RepID=UPI000823943E|nr:MULTISPECIES: lanthionine synthetase C family protein [unclassified Streptomyces]MYU02159.1 hypothetical protein [Streptomyces sp. SID8350]SCK61704.1 Lanthionine synthetase C-like protein [Streptomyces sp. AmelKG-D3]
MNDLLHDLGRGTAGALVRHGVLARHTATWATAHASARALAQAAATIDPSSTGLYRGAPAVAFALHTAGHRAYRPALTDLDEKIAGLITARLSAAHHRMDARLPPRMREYDLIQGLTGLGAYLLSTGTRPRLLDDVLLYLVRLLQQPVTVHGHSLPGWWTLDGTTGEPDPDWPLGHGNFGLAHGVAGPVALLALAARAGHTVPGQHQALTAACDLFEKWLRPLPDGGQSWPETVTLSNWLAGPPATAQPGRPSWCYGTPGIARSLQLAALASAHPRARRRAEDALLSCVTDVRQLDRLQDATVCHGWAGLVLTTALVAADTDAANRLRAELPKLRHAFAARLAVTPVPGGVGLLTGADGTLLTIHTLNPTHRSETGWATCLLLTGKKENDRDYFRSR